MSAPTAEEIRERLTWAHYTDTEARDQAVHRILDWMSAREREHAELLARVERLEKGADDGR